jgi:hypothetical protein
MFTALFHHFWRKIFSARFPVIWHALFRFTVQLEIKIITKQNKMSIFCKCQNSENISATKMQNIIKCCMFRVDYYIHPYNSSSKFLILIWILPIFQHQRPLQGANCQLNPMKHKIVIEIPPYYIDTLPSITEVKQHCLFVCLHAARRARVADSIL